MTPAFASRLVVPLIAVLAGCGSSSTIPSPDLIASALPDLSISQDLSSPPDLSTPEDFSIPPDLSPTPDLASAVNLGDKIFFTGTTFSNTAPALAPVTLPQVGLGNYPNMPPANAQLLATIAVGPLYATYVPNGAAFGATLFKLFCDARTDVGEATQLELIYDFNGDGTSVRTEIWNLFPTDPIVGWELYSEAKGLWSMKGGFANFVGGTLTARVWKTFQANAQENSYYQEGTSYLLLPYK